MLRTRESFAHSRHACGSLNIHSDLATVRKVDEHGDDGSKRMHKFAIYGKLAWVSLWLDFRSGVSLLRVLVMWSIRYWGNPRSCVDRAGCAGILYHAILAYFTYIQSHTCEETQGSNASALQTYQCLGLVCARLGESRSRHRSHPLVWN